MGAILIREKDGVLKNFGYQGSPMWAIFEGKSILDQCCSEDEDERRNRLANTLEMLANSQTTASFEIRYYEEANKSGKINTSSVFFASLPFKVNDSEAALAAMQNKFNSSAGTGNMAQMMPLMMQLFDQKLENVKIQNEYVLQQKDREIEALEEMLAQEPEAAPLDGMGKIGGIVDMIGQAGSKYPWMQDIFKGAGKLINNITNGVAMKYTAMTEQPMQMNGVPPLPTSEASLQDQLKWSQNTLIYTYRLKLGVKMNEQGQPIQDTTGDNERLMNKADEQYVADMIAVAKVASTKPNTWDTALKSLREMV